MASTRAILEDHPESIGEGDDISKSHIKICDSIRKLQPHQFTTEHQNEAAQ